MDNPQASLPCLALKQQQHSLLTPHTHTHTHTQQPLLQVLVGCCLVIKGIEGQAQVPLCQYASYRALLGLSRCAKARLFLCACDARRWGIAGSARAVALCLPILKHAPALTTAANC